MAPDRIKEAIYAAFDIHALYRHDQHQVTIEATITPATPDTIAALTDDPRTTATPTRAPRQPPPPALTRGHTSPARWGQGPTCPDGDAPS